jgi:hypothetical protein
LGRLGQPPRDGVEHKAGVERGNEGNIDGEAGRIPDLRDLHAVDLLALLLGDEIDLAVALAERRPLQGGFEAGETSAVGRPIGEHLATDAPCEHSPDDEGNTLADANLVDGVARRLVVGREHDHVGLGDLGGEAGIGQDIGVDLCDLGLRIPVEQHVGDGIDLLLADVAPAADMAEESTL